MPIDLISLTIAFTQRQIFTYLSDEIKNRPKELYQADFIVKARDKTANRFPKFKKSELKFILERWCHSDKFKNLFKDFQKSPTSDFEVQIVSGFKDTAKEFAGGQEISLCATEILLAFAEELEQSLLRSPKEGVPLLAAKTDSGFAQQQEDASQMKEMLSQILQNQERGREIPSQYLPLATPTGETQPTNTNPLDDKFKTLIDYALQLSDSDKPSDITTAKGIIEKVRGEGDFSDLSDPVKARVATIAAKCADAFGDAETTQKEIDLALTLDPENVRCISNAAGSAMAQSNFQDAVRLAQKAREKQPDDLNAALVLVQSWQHLNESELVEQFLRDQPWFLETSNGCAALAQIRSRQGRFDEAVAHARRSLKMDVESKRNVAALEGLFDALFYPLREKVWEGKLRSYDTRTKRQFKRAEAAANRAIGVLRKGGNKTNLHHFLLNRASVRSAQEKINVAILDCDEVLDNAPTPYNRELALLNKALILIHAGNPLQATPLLESLTDPQRREEGAFSLGYCYYSENRFAEATALWEPLWHPEENEHSHLLVASMLLSAYRAEENNAGAESVLKRLRDSHPNDPEREAIIAQDKYRTGEVDEAIERLREIARSCEQEGEDEGKIIVLLHLADLLYQARDFGEAAAVWHEVGLQNLLPPLRKHYLKALYSTEQDDMALTVAQQILKDDFDPYVAEVKATIHFQRKQWDEAKALYAELLRREPDVPHYRINFASVAVNDQDQEAAKKAIEGISYDTIKNEPELLRQVSSLQAALAMKQAIAFAFRARQVDFGNPDSHRNYFFVFMKSSEIFDRDKAGNKSDILGLNGPRWGEVPCSISLLPVGVTDDRQTQTFTILETPPFDLPRGVYPSQHEFARRLLALKAADVICLKDELALQQPPVEDDREYQVCEVLSPYVHAFRESMKAEKMFGIKALGMTSMDIRGSLREFWAAMEDAGKDAQKLEALYVAWKIPLCSIGTVRVRSLADLWFFVAKKPHWGIHAQAGSLHEFDKIIERMAEEERPVLTLDGTAVLTLLMSGLGDVVAAQYRLLVPHSFYEEATEWQKESTPSHIPLETLEQLLNFLDTKAEIVTLGVIKEISSGDLRKWQRCIGQADLETMVLALRHKALICADDTIYRRMAKIQFEVEGVSVQCILSNLYLQKHIVKEDYFEALEKLAHSNYQNLVLSGEFYIWLLTKYNYLENSVIRAAFRCLEGPFCDEQAALVITTSVIRWMVWSGVNEGCLHDILSLCDRTLITGRPIIDTKIRFRQMLLSPKNSH